MNNTDQAIMKNLRNLKRSNLRELHQKTGYNKDWIWERLQELRDKDYVEKTSRGLYNLTSKGKEKVKEFEVKKSEQREK